MRWSTVDVLLGRRDNDGPPDVVLSIVDASNLERNLFLVSQVLSLGLPTVVALNMVDLARDRHDRNRRRLRSRSGSACPSSQCKRIAAAESKSSKTALVAAVGQPPATLPKTRCPPSSSGTPASSPRQSTPAAPNPSRVFSSSDCCSTATATSKARAPQRRHPTAAAQQLRARAALATSRHASPGSRSHGPLRLGRPHRARHRAAPERPPADDQRSHRRRAHPQILRLRHLHRRDGADFLLDLRRGPIRS